MSVTLKHISLEKENIDYAGSGGVSKGNCSCMFIPAFMDSENGQVAISRLLDGRQASFHLIDGLPEEWVTRRDETGRVAGIKETIVSGFVRLNQFFTRQEAAEYMTKNI
jgi:hypothetical protein